MGRGGRPGGTAPNRETSTARSQLRQRCRRAGVCGRTRRDLARTQPCANRKRLRRRLARLWRRPVVGAGSRRVAPRAIDPSRREGRARPLRGAWRQDDAARRGGSSGRPPSMRSRARLARLRENLDRTHLEAELDRGGRAYLGAAPGSSTRSFSTRRAPQPAPSAATRKFCIAPAATLSPPAPSFKSKLLARAAHWLKPGGALVYSVCSLEPQEGEDVISSLPQGQLRVSRSMRQSPANCPIS